MNIGVHRIGADEPQDYMDLDMLDDLSFGMDIRYALIDFSARTIRIQDLDANEIGRIQDVSEGAKEESLFLKLFQSVDPGSNFLFGYPSDLSDDEDCFVFLYLYGVRKGFHLFFRNVPYMDSDNFTSLNPEQTETILRKFFSFPNDSSTDSRVKQSWIQTLQADSKTKKNLSKEQSFQNLLPKAKLFRK